MLKLKTVILCGGVGYRLKEETEFKPKPMVEVGGKPILWHIMKSYSHYGFNDFLILLGYKGHMIKEYFLNFFYHNNSFEIDLKNNKPSVINHGENNLENWKVTLLDTGLDTQTGGRLKRAEKFIGKETFMVTYGDGLTDLNIKTLYDFHKKQGKLATLSAVIPPARFGALEIEGDQVKRFVEKPHGSEALVNGGFYVFEPSAFKYFDADDTMALEKKPMDGLSKAGQLAAFKHTGFWQCMDTRRDVDLLNEQWATKKAGWKVW